jgi:hypothetical protein
MTYVQQAERFEAAFDRARRRSDPDLALVAMLDREVFDSWSRSTVLEALGGTTGPAGSLTLRNEFDSAVASFATASSSSRWEYRDLICTCTWALGRREGPYATDYYMMAADHSNADVRRYGMTAMAVVGDDRAWGPVLSRLAERMTTKVKRGSQRWIETLLAIEYLARHAPKGSGRAAELIGLLRDRWRYLEDSGPIEEWWPGIGPGGRQAEQIDLQSHVHAAPWRR